MITKQINCMIMYVLIPIVAYAIFKLYQKWTCGMCTCSTRMGGKVVIVTGANTGIGYETAKDLASRGARVIVACRDQRRGETAASKIRHDTGNTRVAFKQLDLASFDSVKAFAADILRSEPALHVLINNAGTGKLDNALTPDNLPIEAQVNHFGPFLLTKLLLPLIKSSAPSRIIVVSSVLHKVGVVNTNNFHKQVKTWYEHMRVYSNTKLANVLFTRKLSADLKDSGVTVNCLHPGGVHTDIFRNRSRLTRMLLNLVLKTPHQGAQTTIYLAVAPELENTTGKYFVDCCEASTSNSAKDYKLAESLWELSERVTNC